MITAHLIHTAAAVLAGRPTPTPTATTTDTGTDLPIKDAAFNSSGIIHFLVMEIAPILVVILGVVILSRARAGQVSKTVTSSGIALLGMVMIAGAGVWLGLGDSIVKMIVH